MGDGDHQELTVDNATVNGDIDLGAGGDVLTLDLDDGAINPTSPTGGISGGADIDTLALNDTDGSGEVIDLDEYVLFEQLDLAGDGVITIDDTSDLDPVGANNTSFATVNLADDTDLVISDDSTLTAFINGGTLGTDVEVEGVLAGDIDLDAGDDSFIIDVVSGGSYTPDSIIAGADGGAGTDTVSILADGAGPQTVNLEDLSLIHI